MVSDESLQNPSKNQSKRVRVTFNKSESLRSPQRVPCESPTSILSIHPAPLPSLPPSPPSSSLLLMLCPRRRRRPGVVKCSMFFVLSPNVQGDVHATGSHWQKMRVDSALHFGKRSPLCFFTSFSKRSGSSLHKPRTSYSLLISLTQRCKRTANCFGV